MCLAHLRHNSQCTLMAFPLAIEAAEAGMTLWEYMESLDAADAAAEAFENAGGYLGASVKALLYGQLAVLGVYTVPHVFSNDNANSSQPARSDFRNDIVSALKRPDPNPIAGRPTRKRYHYHAEFPSAAPDPDNPDNNNPFVSMAYSKVRFARKRKPTYRRKYYGRRRKATRSGVNKIRKVIYSVAEKKYTDIAVTHTNPIQTWNFQPLGPALSQGTTVGNRSGNRVNVRYIEMQHSTAPAAPATFNGAILRCIILWVRNNKNATTVTRSDVFVDEQQQSIRNREKITDFAILADWNVTIPQGSQTNVDIRKIIRVNKQVVYNNNLGTLADMPEGALYFGCYSTNGTSGQLTCGGKFRIHFVDV